MKWYELHTKQRELCKEWCSFLFNKDYDTSDNYYQVLTCIVLNSTIGQNITDKLECIKECESNNWIFTNIRESLYCDVTQEPPIYKADPEWSDFYSQFIGVQPPKYVDQMIDEHLLKRCAKQFKSVSDFCKSIDKWAVADDQYLFAIICGLDFLAEVLEGRAKFDEKCLTQNVDGLYRYKSASTSITREWYKINVSDASLQVVSDFEFHKAFEDLCHTSKNICRFMAAMCCQITGSANVTDDTYSDFLGKVKSGQLSGDAGLAEIVSGLVRSREALVFESKYATMADLKEHVDYYGLAECLNFMGYIYELYMAHIGPYGDGMIGLCYNSDVKKLWLAYLLSDVDTLTKLENKQVCVWFFDGSHYDDWYSDFYFDDSLVAAMFIRTWKSSERVRKLYENHIERFMLQVFEWYENTGVDQKMNLGEIIMTMIKDI